MPPPGMPLLKTRSGDQERDCSFPPFPRINFPERYATTVKRLSIHCIIEDVPNLPIRCTRGLWLLSPKVGVTLVAFNRVYA